MKTKTAFQFLKKELPLPKQVIIDDKDMARVNEPISKVTDIMDKYAEERIAPFLNMLIEICTDASESNLPADSYVKKKLIKKAEKYLSNNPSPKRKMK